MNKEFCCRCGLEIESQYDGWYINATDRRRGTPWNRELSGLICDTCAEPALGVIREAVSGEVRNFRLAEVAQ